MSEKRKEENVKKVQEENRETQNQFRTRSKEEIEFRKRMDARGSLSKDNAKGETEASTIGYISRYNEEEATKKIKKHPVIVFSTDKVLHCNTPIRKMYYVGAYYDKETEKSKETGTEKGRDEGR